MDLKIKEQAFVHEYLISGGNAYQAAKKAGYAPSTAKHAYQWLEDDTKINQTSRRLPFKPYLAAAIDEELKKIEEAKIADVIEIQQYLTSVMRKESRSECIMVVGTGEGRSETQIIEKAPDEKEAMKAAELLGKARGMFSDRLDINADMDLNITIDYGDDG